MSNRSHPFAAIHVRRTDKFHEAANQPIEKYMAVVEHLYQLEEARLGLTVRSLPRKVFVATDDHSAVEEVK